MWHKRLHEFGNDFIRTTNLNDEIVDRYSSIDRIQVKQIIIRNYDSVTRQIQKRNQHEEYLYLYLIKHKRIEYLKNNFKKSLMT